MSDDLIHELERRQIEVDDIVRRLLLEAGGAAVLADFDAKIKLIRNGVTGARNAWHSITPAQQRALMAVVDHGGRLIRDGKVYRDRDRHMLGRPVLLSTLHPLCSRELMAWDGGAF